eukprot:scpid29679/ scgid23207/ 
MSVAFQMVERNDTMFQEVLGKRSKVIVTRAATAHGYPVRNLCGNWGFLDMRLVLLQVIVTLIFVAVRREEWTLSTAGVYGSLWPSSPLSLSPSTYPGASPWNDSLCSSRRNAFSLGVLTNSMPRCILAVPTAQD